MLFKTMFKQWNCFLSFVWTEGKMEVDWNMKKLGHLSLVKFVWALFFVWEKAMSNLFST